MQSASFFLTPAKAVDILVAKHMSRVTTVQYISHGIPSTDYRLTTLRLIAIAHVSHRPKDGVSPDSAVPEVVFSSLDRSELARYIDKEKSNAHMAVSHMDIR